MNEYANTRESRLAHHVSTRQLNFAHGHILLSPDRLQVVSNFGDGDCGAKYTYTRLRNFEETRPEGSARVCVFHPPHNRHRQN